MSKFIETRPQRLCLMCGRCCRVATTVKTYEELLELSKNGDEGAINFLKIFEPYPSVEAAREVDAKTVDNILMNIENSDNPSVKVTFYRCKYIKDDNLCGIYKERPELCERFPTTAWAVVPPGCGFEGWQFLKREELMQKIRRQKEHIIELEAELPAVKNPELAKRIRETIEKTKETIKAFSHYGSENW